MYKYILFDWDGCLVNSLQEWLNAHREELRKYDLHPTDEEIVNKTFGQWNILRNFGIKKENHYDRDVIQNVKERLRDVKLHNNVLETLAELKKRHKHLAILTSSSKELLSNRLQELGIANVFDLILDMKDVTHHKPDPEIIFKAIKALGANKTETMIVGDSDKDVGAGKNAGITTVQFYPLANHVFYSQEIIDKDGADFVIRDFRELLKIVG